MVDVAAIANDVDEDEAWELYRALSSRFGWVGILFERSSVEVWDDEKRNTVPITDEEFEAVRATSAWSDEIRVIAARAAHQWLPRVERHPDGSFEVMGGDGWGRRANRVDPVDRCWPIPKNPTRQVSPSQLIRCWLAARLVVPVHHRERSLRVAMGP